MTVLPARSSSTTSLFSAKVKGEGVLIVPPELLVVPGHEGIVIGPWGAMLVSAGGATAAEGDAIMVCMRPEKLAVVRRTITPWRIRRRWAFLARGRGVIAPQFLGL